MHLRFASINRNPALIMKSLKSANHNWLYVETIRPFINQRLSRLFEGKRKSEFSG